MISAYPKSNVERFLRRSEFDPDVIRETIEEESKRWKEKGMPALENEDFESLAANRADSIEVKKSAAKLEIGDWFYEQCRFTSL